MASRDLQLSQDDADSQSGQDGEEEIVDVSIKNEELDVEDDEDSESDESEESDDDDDDDDDDNDEEGEEEETENADEGVSEDDDEDEDAEGDDDSDEDEDDDEEEEEEDAEQGEEVADADDSSSGDENADRCPICLNRLRVQDIGTPESCDHSFCLECIQAWAKNVNTCPVDRQVFRIILGRHAGEEKIFKQFPVEDSQQENEEVEEDPTYCEVCGQSDREDRLLLCDRCDLGYHCDCLDPPLASVPVHEWFCPDCQQSRAAVDTEHHGSGRQIARTRISERVRRLIAEARAERAERRRRVAEMIVAQEALEGAEATLEPSVSATTSAVKATRKKTTKTTRKRRTSKKKTVRKRKKTTKKRKTKRKSTGKKTKTKKRRSKGKGKRKVKKNKSTSSASSTALARTAISRAVTSVKGRIADKLGLSKPPAGRSIPMQKLPPSGSRQEGPGRSFADHGASALSLLGSKDELYLFADQEGEERQPVSRPAISAEILLSRSARSSHKPLSFSPVKKKVVVEETPSAPASASVVSGGFDLLGSILQNQDLLHKGSKHVTINRDGSLTAANTGLSRSSTQIRTTASLQMTSPSARNSTDSPTTSASESPTRESKSVTSTSPSKSQPQRSVSFSSNSVSPTDAPDSLRAAVSPTDAPDNVRAANDVRVVTTVETHNNNLTASLDKSDFLPDVIDSETKYSCLSMDISVDDTQDSNAAKSLIETEQCLLASVDGVKHDNDDDSLDNVYSSTASSGSTDGENGVKFNFADVRKTAPESKPLTSSESSSDGIDNIKSNNSPSVGSRESDTALNTIINDSPEQDTADVKSGVDLEADAIFSNNARLNAEEDAGNNSIGFSTPTNSQTSLRNFAAVSSDLNSVHDDSSVGIMKRNFDILVSTSSNLAGYESGEENDNIEGFVQNPADREEGEASESEEDEVKGEDRQRAEEGQEEGEIVDEEERERYHERRNMCAEENEDSGGLDVNAIHIEEMEIGTFRKRSMSQNEDNNNEDNKKIKIDDGAANGTEAKEESLQEVKEEEESDEEDYHLRKPVGRSSFMLSSILSSLKASDFDGAKENDKSRDRTEKKAEEGEIQKVERQKVKRQNSEPEKEEGVTIKPISILDFIGDASAKKFGLDTEEVEIQKVERQNSDPEKEEGVTVKPVSILDFIGDASVKKFGLDTDDIDKDRESQDVGYHRGYSSYSGGNSYGQRDSRPNGDRRRNQWQRDRRGGDAEAGHGNVEAALPRSFDRRKDSWQEDEKRSGSRDNRSSNQRSDSHEQRLSKSHHGKESEKGHRRRDESRERVVRSRSRSGSRSPRKGEKRKRDKYHEDKNKHEKRRKSRWNQETEEVNEKEDGKQDMEVEQKKENDVSKVQANGHLTNVGQEARQVASDHYQSQQYPAAYPYSRAPMPPLVRPPPHHLPQMHAHIPPPGLPFNHSASLGHQQYSQTQHGHSGHQMNQVRPPHLQGFPASYYPHISGVPPRVPPPPHAYPHAMYAGNARYPSQPGQSAASLAHHGAPATAGQPHSGYPRYPQPASHSYTQPAPHGTYPPRPAVPAGAAVPATVYSPATATAAAAPAYPPQPPQSAPTTPAVPRYNYPAASTKQDTAVAHSVTSVKAEPIFAASTAPLEPQKPSHKHTQKARETLKESPAKEVKPPRARYPASPPPAAPIKGITTFDRVDSSILLNEVKKGFRQLVEDAVRSALKGAWSLKKITKDEYKDIFKRSVEKVCGSKETVVNQEKIQSLVNAYVSKTRKLRKT